MIFLIDPLVRLLLLFIVANSLIRLSDLVQWFLNTFHIRMIETLAEWTLIVVWIAVNHFVEIEHQMDQRCFSTGGNARFIPRERACKLFLKCKTRNRLPGKPQFPSWLISLYLLIKPAYLTQRDWLDSMQTFAMSCGRGEHEDTKPNVMD